MRPLNLISRIFTFLSVILVTATPSSAQSDTEFQSGYEKGGLCFYELPNFKGGKYCAKSGEKIGKLGSKWNNAFSSVQLDDSVTVYACTKPGFGGECRFIERSAYKLGDDLNDRISSVQISQKSNPIRPQSTYQASEEERPVPKPLEEREERPSETTGRVEERDRPQTQRRRDEEDLADLRTPTPGRREDDRRRPDVEDTENEESASEEAEKPEVCFFERRKFRGRSMCFTESQVVNELRGRWNNTISSVRTRGEVEIRLCDRPGLEGECLKFTGSKRFIGWEWNDRISSIKMRFPYVEGEEEANKEKDEVCFYEHKGFEGRSFCVPAGETVKRLGYWDDRISSFIIHGNAKVRICSNIYLEGDCTTFRRSKRFVGWSWNDEISSVRIGLQPPRED